MIDKLRITRSNEIKIKNRYNLLEAGERRKRSDKGLY